MPDAVNPDRNSLVYVYPGDDGPADGDTIQFNAATGRWEAVQGGTSVPDEWLQVTNSGPLTPAHGVQTFVPWTADNDPVRRGTDIEWAIGTPTVVIIGAGGDGVYDVAFAGYVTGGTAQTFCSTYVFLNDDSVGPLYYWTAAVEPPTGKNQGFSVTVPRVALVAGDTLKLSIQQTGNTSDDTLFGALVMAVTRVG